MKRTLILKRRWYATSLATSDSRVLALDIYPRLYYSPEVANLVKATLPDRTPPIRWHRGIGRLADVYKVIGHELDEATVEKCSRKLDAQITGKKRQRTDSEGMLEILHAGRRTRAPSTEGYTEDDLGEREALGSLGTRFVRVSSNGANEAAGAGAGAGPGPSYLVAEVRSTEHPIANRRDHVLPQQLPPPPPPPPRVQPAVPALRPAPTGTGPSGERGRTRAGAPPRSTPEEDMYVATLARLRSEPKFLMALESDLQCMAQALSRMTFPRALLLTAEELRMKTVEYWAREWDDEVEANFREELAETKGFRGGGRNAHLERLVAATKKWFLCLAADAHHGR